MRFKVGDDKMKFVILLTLLLTTGCSLLNKKDPTRENNANLYEPSQARK